MCNATFSILDIDGLDCTCTISLVDDANSALGSMECSVAEGCLDENDILCGKGDLNGSIEAGENGIGLTITSCVYIDTNLLPDDDIFANSTIGPYDLCVDAFSEPGSWGFDECAASIDGESCDCSVCDNFGVEFDCTAIDGPKLPLCSPLDFLLRYPKNDGDDLIVPVDDIVDDAVYPVDDQFDDFLDDDTKIHKGPKSGKGSRSEKNTKDDDDEW